MNQVTGGSHCACAPSELHKQQLDYAWKWFCFHADQRTKIYNFMLVALAFITAGIASIVDKGLHWGVMAVLCGVAALLAIGFMLLDRRNRDLVWLGEDMLADLEANVLFPDRITKWRGLHRPTGQTSTEFVPGILIRDADPHMHGYDGRWRYGFGRNLLLGKHRLLLPGIALIFALLFVAAGIWVSPIGGDPRAPKTQAPCCPVDPTASKPS